MSNEPRSNKIFLYVGDRDRGKTSFIKNCIPSFPQPKGLIIDLFDSPVWHTMKTWDHPEWESKKIPLITPEQVKNHQYGLYRTYCADTDYMENIIASDISNCSVVLEDASRYFEPVLTKKQRIYLLNSKQKNVDFHLVFHYLSDIAPRLVKMADYITIFKTDELEFNAKRFHQKGFADAVEYVAKSKNPHECVSIKLKN